MRKRFAVLLAFSFAGLACGVMSGCSKPGGPSNIVPISGRITCNGEPLDPGVVVQFIPLSAGRPAFAVIEDDGRFTLTTRAANDGAIVARHRVVIQPHSGAPEGEEEDDSDDVEYEEIPLPCPAPHELYVLVTRDISVVEIEMADGGSVITR